MNSYSPSWRKGWPPTPCSREAPDFTKARLLGQTVGLERDVSDTDAFGRYLRYVWADGELFNERLVRDGYARVAVYPPDVKYQAQMAAAQSEAQAAGRGLWGACEYFGAPATPAAGSTATATSVATATATTPPGSGVTITYITSPISRGSTPSLNAKTSAYASCTIEYWTPSGNKSSVGRAGAEDGERGRGRLVELDNRLRYQPGNGERDRDLQRVQRHGWTIVVTT